ncbi:hypothetical protein [Orenia marismortui]|uniref:hypothetical protein n=1 Tax=Orenia marismortui TaxID=46469 RepID=UPI0003617EDA|nr:hypothetical protein [Orenia marismortui]
MINFYSEFNYHFSTILEVTTLLIPGLNNSEEEIEELVDWIATLDTSIPLHFSKYFPKYQLDILNS